MGIQSTRYITRQEAIDRIKKISALVILKEYEKIVAESTENDNVEHFVDYGVGFSPHSVQNWTNEMLEATMDMPFFRYSMFDNYVIKEVVDSQ